MQFLKQFSLSFLFLFFSTSALLAHVNPDRPRKAAKTNKASYRMDCAPGGTQVDQSINNVRARLLTGGDTWWDGKTNARYVVPKVDPASGLPEVSAIFSGAVWLGGIDDAGNLKVAAQTYGSADGLTDFWPGPLTANGGTIDAQTCVNWDKIFKVLGANIDIHLANYELFSSQGISYDPDLIPEDVKHWPARGNPYFEDFYGFPLPNDTQGLGAFYDRNGNLTYEPEEGDYPIIEVSGCEDPIYPDEMFFRVYNDAGGIHTQSTGAEIRMEVQVQAFAYATNDEINNMTFQRYKLINRAIETIDSTHFAMWVDPDLGCHTDDYVGCDVSRSLAYVYNEDEIDGEVGGDCPGGVEPYRDGVPLLGVDYFRGPRDEFFNEIGMSSFTYYNNADGNTGPMTDPLTGVEFFRYLTGSWRDGTPFTFGGTGYNPGSTDYINYAFNGAPDNVDGWSMCSEALGSGDRRTIQATGPFRLIPGAVNELIIGAVWVPAADYPCPDISDLLAADDLAQALFENCFKILDGPDAPNVDWIEMDREVIAVLTNDTNKSSHNNAYEEYSETDIFALNDIPDKDKQYIFEGYKVFQLSGPSTTAADINNPELARLIETVDIKNGIRELYNWRGVDNPSELPDSPAKIWIPELKTENATDEGIQHTFRIFEDQFAEEDRRLINHKKYYYLVIAYAHNEYEEFKQDGDILLGQRRPYLPGRKKNKIHVVIPRPIVDVTLNANFGEGTVITRLDGKGSGNNYLGVDKEVRDGFLDPSFDGKIVYRDGQGPIEVKVFDPLRIKNGQFRIEFIDENMDNDQLDKEVKWRLINLENNETIFAERTIDRLNEQIIPEYGFSVILGQGGEPGDGTERNGALGAGMMVEDESLRWLSFVVDGIGDEMENFVQTGSGEIDFDLDPYQGLSQVGSGTFVPFYLTNYRKDTDVPVISPAWVSTNGRNVRRKMSLEQLNNVDIVFTSDKSKWSRCVVVESASELWGGPAAGLETEGNVDQFELRPVPSVGKEDNNRDGLPDEDNEVDETGERIEGMGWFPGYAVDVETGDRLNIFFGENSTYRKEYDQFFGGDTGYGQVDIGGKRLGNDMMWNPSDQQILNPPALFLAQNHYGGHHFIYVTDEIYDGCEKFHSLLQGTTSNKINALKRVTWSAIPILSPGQELRSYAEGLIPTETVVELRVTNNFDTDLGTGEHDGYPAYEFAFDGVEAEPLTTRAEVNGQLDAIRVVPNPYYGFSDYETSQFTNTVKVTNLPAKSTVTIFTLDGKFVRQYKRNEVGADISARSGKAFYVGQIVPDVEWDLKNNRGVPVSSGTYLIHIDAPGLGERVIKWFGIGRQFDPTGL